MDLFVSDDSSQRKPSRKGMNRLVAAGGVHVPSAAVRDLEYALNALCAECEFPPGEEFKWSPEKRQWMHRGLVFAERDEFFARAMSLGVEHELTALVVIEDAKRGRAVPESASAEEDVVTLFLERADNHLRASSTSALVIADRPSGNRAAEGRFLASCIERMRTGTTYADLDHLALLLTTDSRSSRLLQLADVVTGCTLAYFAGETRFSPGTFAHIKPLLRRESGRIGGVGVKLQPDFTYANLYHWLLGDEHLKKGFSGIPLPTPGRPYFASPDEP